MRPICLALLLALTSCTSPSEGFGVALTIRVDESVSDAQLASVRSLVYTTAGFSETYPLPATRSLGRTERVLYRPAPGTSTVDLAVAAEDAGGSVVATGSTAALALTAGQTTDATLVLSRTAPGDLAGLDLTTSSEFDLGPTFDLFPAGDQGPPRDLAAGCEGLYCFTFEGDSTDSSSLLSAGCSLITDGTAHSGKGYQRCNAQVDQVYQSLTVPFGSGAARIGFRAWMRIHYATVGPATNAVFMSIDDLNQTYLQVGTDGSGKLSGIYTDAPNSNAPISSASASDTGGAWRCVSIFVDRTVDEVSFSLDGTLVGTAGNVVVPSAYERIVLGVFATSSNHDVPIQLDIDDAVVADGPVGCD